MAADPSPSLVRLSISIPAELFAELDAMVGERQVANRSQMIAELIPCDVCDLSAGKYLLRCAAELDYCIPASPSRTFKG